MRLTAARRLCLAERRPRRAGIAKSFWESFPDIFCTDGGEGSSRAPLIFNPSTALPRRAPATAPRGLAVAHTSELISDGRERVVRAAALRGNLKFRFVATRVLTCFLYLQRGG